MRAPRAASAPRAPRAPRASSALSVALLIGWITGCASSSSRAGFVESGERGRIELATRDTRVTLAGRLAEELATVIGAYVKVWGASTGSTVTVSRYQILDAGNGFFAYVGWLTIDQMGCALVESETGRRWSLLGLDPAEIRSLHGAKVWVTGVEEGPADLRPLAWGVLRPARP